MSSACLTTQLRLIGFGRKSREQRDVGLEIAFAEDRRLVGEPEQEDGESRKVERVVLHVGVHEVDRGARRLPRVDQDRSPELMRP